SPSTKRTLAPIVSPVRKRASPPPTIKKPGLILELFGSSDDDRDLEDPGTDGEKGQEIRNSDTSEGEDSDSSSSSDSTVTSIYDSDPSVQIDPRRAKPTVSPAPMGIPSSLNSPLASPSSPTDPPSVIDIHAIAVKFFAGVYDFNLDDCDRKATEFCDWYQTANLANRDLSQCLASFLVESNSPDHD
ncbi:unnamed protein product, partial [Allacma fusca]